MDMLFEFLKIQIAFDKLEVYEMLWNFYVCVFFVYSLGKIYSNQKHTQYKPIGITTRVSIK